MKQTLRLTTFFSLILYAVAATAQWNSVGFKHLETVVNQDLNYVFGNWDVNNPQVTDVDHGSVTITTIDNNWRQLIYSPQPDFIGVDTIRLNSFVAGGNGMADVTYLEIFVLPSQVAAENDFATTPAGTSVSIPVLDNDFGNGAWLRIARIPAVNSGDATFNADSTEVIFTPVAGFTGIANLNYTICDSEGVCDMAIVNVCVTDPNAISEVLNVFTVTNETQVLLTDVTGLTLTDAPQRGTVDEFDGQLFYTPHTDSTGMDYVRYEGTLPDGTIQARELFVRTLDRPARNEFVQDDYVYTNVNVPAEFNILDNDLGGGDLSGFPYIFDKPDNLIPAGPKGMYIYVPDTDFEGVVELTYRVGVAGKYEHGIIRIVVSDLAPVNTTLPVQTPVNQPLVLDYAIPTVGHSFALTGSPTSGTVQLTGSYSAGGQQATGHQLIVYEPQAGATGTDEFEVEYCATESGTCNTVKIQVDLLPAADPATFCLADNCVWAGDTDRNGIVNAADLLTLGLHMGEVGNSRAVGTDFYGTYGTDWANPFVSSTVDLKHADTDGDGIISALDTMAIYANYGKRHALTPPRPLPDYDAPQLYFGDYPVDAEVGDFVQIPVYLGHPNQPVFDVHGFTFNLNYPSGLVDDFSVELHEDSWMSYNSPVLSLDVEPFEGLKEVGYTRTSATSLSGYGIIGTLDFIIIEDISDVRLPSNPTIDIYLTGGGTMGSDGQYHSGTDATASIALNLGGTETETPCPLTDDQLKVFPNPAGAQITVHLNGAANEMESVQLFTFAGQLLETQPVANGKHLQLDLSNYPQGSYLVRAVTNRGVVHQTVQVVR